MAPQDDYLKLERYVETYLNDPEVAWETKMEEVRLLLEDRADFLDNILYLEKNREDQTRLIAELVVQTASRELQEAWSKNLKEGQPLLGL